jgi:excisionase family DNA binding protein
MTIMAERALTVREVAAEYGVTPATVYGWIRDGFLRPLRLPGGDYRFRREHIEEFDRQCRDASSPAQTTDSGAEVEFTSSSGQTRSPVQLDPYRRGKLMSGTRKSGWTNG